MNTLRKLAFVFALVLGAGLPAHATTVTSTFTATGFSSTIFVPAGQKLRIQLLNTFVGTVKVWVSYDAGSSYQLESTNTATLVKLTDAQLRNATYKLECSAYTSGTVTYSMDSVPLPVVDRAKFSNVPVGSVAYGSFGSVLNPPVAGTLYVTDLRIGRDMTVQGIGVLNGTPCGTDKYVLWLFDSAGTALGSTSLSGTTCSGTDAFQEIALTNEVGVTAGLYHIGVRMSGTTDRTRFVAGSTFIGLKTSATAHSSFIIGSFGSAVFGIPVPTTFTAGQAPIAYVYGY